MPDLASHALIPYAGIRVVEIIRRRQLVGSSERYLLVLGSIFPDLLDKTIPYALHYFSPNLTENNFYFPSLKYLHTPLMLLFSIYVIGFIFQDTYRKRVFCMLSAGVFFHLLFDLFQGNICGMGYMWLFPFSMEKPMLINLFYDDSTVPFVPFLLLLVLLIEIVFRISRKRFV